MGVVVTPQSVKDALADAETALGLVIDMRPGWVGDGSLAELEIASRAALRRAVTAYWLEEDLTSAVPGLRGDR